MNDLRSASAALLGNKYRIELGAAIANGFPGNFHAKALAEATGIEYQQVQQDLQRLQRAGMVARVADTNSRFQWYKPRSSSYWEMCKQLRSEFRPTE